MPCSSFLSDACSRHTTHAFPRQTGTAIESRAVRSFCSRFGLPPLAQVNHVQLPEDMDPLLSFISAMGPEEALVHFVDSGGGGTRASCVRAAVEFNGCSGISACIAVE